MSKNLPLKTIRQTSDENLLKLITDNTLAEMGKNPPLLTPKENEALIEEASKRKLFRTVRNHYDLTRDTQLVLVDVNVANWKNRYIVRVISEILDKWLMIANIYTNDKLKPVNQDQKDYQTALVNVYTPNHKFNNPEEWLKEWEFTVIEVKRYLLQISELSRLISYEVLTDKSKEFIRNSRFILITDTKLLKDDLDQLLYSYNKNKKFRLWLNNTGIKRNHIKKAIEIINKQLGENVKSEDLILKVVEFKEKYKTNLEPIDYYGQVKIEEIGLSQNDYNEVKKYVELIKQKYGLNQ